VIRKNIKKLGWPAAIMIIIAFVLWGAPRLFGGRRAPTYAGTIFGKTVSFDEYYASLRTCILREKMRYGDRFEQIERYLDLEGQAWDRLILLTYAKRKHLLVDDDEVRAGISANPYFQTDGKFDYAKYESLVNPRAYEEELRKTLLISKLVDSILSQVKVTDEEIRNEYEKEFARVRVSYILLESKDLEKEVEVTQKELESYYNENSQIFKRPAQVNVEYIAFNYADYEDKASIADEAITEYYDAQLEEFKVAKEPKEDPTSYKTLEEVKDLIKKRLILSEAREMAEDRAEEVFFDLIDNPDWQDFAKKNLLTIKETGYFSKEESIASIGFSPRFSVAAFSLEPGQISDPIYTTNACYIIRVKEIKQPYIPSFKETKEKVREVVTDLKAWGLCERRTKKYHLQIEEMMTESGTKFEDAADHLSLEVKDSGSIARGDYIPGIGENPGFIETAFSLEIDELSPIIKTDLGYAILKLDSSQPIDEEKFKEDMDEYRTKVLYRKRGQTFIRWFNQLKKEASLKSNIISK